MSSSPNSSLSLSLPKPDANSDLTQWLGWMEQWHPVGIDLGLSRAQRVYQNLRFTGAGIPTIVVGGTNGKGSVTAYLESILSKAGYKTGVYRSPHLIDYNERVRVANQNASDAQIIEGFVATLEHCGQDTLSYFEFSTLAALETFAQQAIDIAILEVGLGGRLDVVNVTDPIISIVTNVGIDHVEWLGNDRDVIGFEKAHIYRPHKLAICGDRQPPSTLFDVAKQIGANLSCIGEHFDLLSGGFVSDQQSESTQSSSLLYQQSAPDLRIDDLPYPQLLGQFQVQNVACALRAITALSAENFTITQAHMREGIADASLPGRMQRLAYRGRTLLLDVAHNEDAVSALIAGLGQDNTSGSRPIACLFGVMADKAIASMVSKLAPSISHWYLTKPSLDRAIGVEKLATIVVQYSHPSCITRTQSVAQGLEQMIDDHPPLAQQYEQPLLLVIGSFYTVGEALKHIYNTTPT